MFLYSRLSCSTFIYITVKNTNSFRSALLRVWWSSAAGCRTSPCFDELQQTSRRPRWRRPAAHGRRWRKTRHQTLREKNKHIIHQIMEWSENKQFFVLQEKLFKAAYTEAYYEHGSTNDLPYLCESVRAHRKLLTVSSCAPSVLNTHKHRLCPE